MKRSLFISLILCQFMWGCLPGDRESVATKPRVTTHEASTTPAAATGDYLWISLKYFMGQLGSSLEFSVLTYDPLTYPTPDPSLYPGRQDGVLPHVRFRSETGEIITDIPLKMVIHQDYMLIDGGLWIEWEAFVPDISEYECVELLSQSELAITKFEIEPPLRMC
jgi:hypothetical protein